MIQFAWPLDPRVYPISRDFYYRSSIYVGGQHMALDFAAPAGTPPLAIARGKAVGVGWDFYSGFFTALEHTISGIAWRSFYRHLFGMTPLVVGQTVNQGQIIGNVGATGWSTGNHLHFDLWCKTKKSPEAIYKVGWWAHDPKVWLGKEQEDDDMLIAIRKVGTGTVYATDGIYKWGIPNPTVWNEMQAKGLIKPGLVDLSAATFDKIKVRP